MDEIANTTCPVPLLLRAIRNDSILVRLVLQSARTQRRLPLTGFSGVAQIYDAPNANMPKHTLTVVVSQDGVGLANTGLVTISLGPDVSGGWLQDGFWVLVLTSGQVRKSVVSGPWEMRGPVYFDQPIVCGLCPVPGYESVAGNGCSSSGELFTTIKLPYPPARPSCNC